MLSKDELRALAELASLATHGPYGHDAGGTLSPPMMFGANGHAVAEFQDGVGQPARYNAAYVTAALNALPALLTHITEREKRIVELEDVVKPFAHTASTPSFELKDDDHYIFTDMAGHRIMLGDLRRAAALTKEDNHAGR